MGIYVHCVDQGGHGCPNFGENLRGSGSGGSGVWVGDMGDDTTHWEASGKISPQGVPQADRKTTLEREGRLEGVYPSVVIDGWGGVTGGGDLYLPP